MFFKSKTTLYVLISYTVNLFENSTVWDELHSADWATVTVTNVEITPSPVRKEEIKRTLYVGK